MKLYRFAIHPAEEGIHFLECINDPKLFTQARSMDDALYMARDLVEAMYEIKGALIEFVIPPDVTTAYEERQRARHLRERSAKRKRERALAGRR
jgi:hypothetical protein